MITAKQASFFSQDSQGQFQGEVAYTLIDDDKILVITHLMCQPHLSDVEQRQVAEQLFKAVIAHAKANQDLIWPLGPEALAFFNAHPEYHHLLIK